MYIIYYHQGTLDTLIHCLWKPNLTDYTVKKTEYEQITMNKWRIEDLFYVLIRIKGITTFG